MVESGPPLAPRPGVRSASAPVSTTTGCAARHPSGDQPEGATLGIDQEGGAPVGAELLAGGRVDAREELRRLERGAERAGDLEERGRGARLRAQALVALLEPLRQARERGVLPLQVRAVEEALLREEEEEEGRRERLDAAERRRGEAALVREEHLVP